MGRLPSSEPRKMQIQRLWSNHKEILRRAALGQKSVSIAKDLGVTPAVVSYTRNSEIGKAHLAQLEDAADAHVIGVTDRIQEIAPRAVEILNLLMEHSDSPHLQASVAKDFLDRAGFSAVKKIDTRSLTTTMTADDFEEIRKRAAESGILSK